MNHSETNIMLSNVGINVGVNVGLKYEYMRIINILSRFIFAHKQNDVIQKRNGIKHVNIPEFMSTRSLVYPQ